MINRRSISALAISGALAFGAAGAAQAKHGSDDPPSHDSRDDHGKRHGGKRHHGKHHHGEHHRGGHDDGPNHT